MSDDVIPADGWYRYSVGLSSGTLFLLEADAEDELDAVYSTNDHSLPWGTTGTIAVLDGAVDFGSAIQAAQAAQPVPAPPPAPPDAGHHAGYDYDEDPQYEQVRQWEQEAQQEWNAELDAARNESYAISIERIAGMVAKDAPSSAKRVPIFAGEGVLAVGEGHPLALLNWFGPHAVTGFLRFERHRFKPNEFVVEGIQNPAGMDTSFVLPLASALIGAVASQGRYPWPDIERISIHEG